MKDLIEALQIFAKYVTDDYYFKHPTHCEHDVLRIMSVHKDQLTEDEQKRVEELGFFWDEGEDCYMSFRFGSA